MIDDETALLDILDTAGQEEFNSMQDQWMRDGQGFLLVYNITSRPTFDEVSTLYDKILRTKDADKVPIVLVGNKCDLKDERQVEYCEGSDLAKNWQCSFFETSAKIKLNNEACFFQLVREIRKSKPRDAGKPKKKGILHRTINRLNFFFFFYRDYCRTEKLLFVYLYLFS